MSALIRTQNKMMVEWRVRVRAYWTLIKSLQTGLLLLTGIAGYTSARCPITDWTTLLGLIGSLFFAISGSTVLNMWHDRDIDAKMQRTAHRPLPRGIIRADEALRVGLVLAILGIAWAVALAPLYGLVVFAGLFLDVVVYTMWLKRRTAWSIVWGGLSGGMPALAGRALGVGAIDWIGVLLALAVLLWIPTHILTFSIKHADDYRRARVPVFPNTHGARFTRALIGVATSTAVIVMLLTTYLIGINWGYWRVGAGLGAVMIVAATISALHPSSKLNFALFKMASLYMTSSMGLVIAGG